ncbi:ExbD/TolR family protein [Neolewinella persica]|uniref:ExbD/TolR family protein n=1 Tax=Neolewinella persica TaxID=70998 RepID=UPI00037C1D7A|nr:biopolymer transporter ExbD [Neolewinella persica]
MSDKKTRRESPAVNAGSMADIAFLLLIFFLVTTTIQEDQGILVKLPQWNDDEIILEVPDNNVLTVLINKNDFLLVEDQEVRVADIPGLVRDHVISPKRTPKQAVVSLTHDRGTSYARYLDIYDALKTGYLLMWDDLANRRFGTRFDMLDAAQQRSIKEEIPMIISEAEPSNVDGLAIN